MGRNSDKVYRRECVNLYRDDGKLGKNVHEGNGDRYGIATKYGHKTPRREVPGGENGIPYIPYF